MADKVTKDEKTTKVEKTEAQTQGAEIAQAISQGLKDAKKDNFVLEADPGINARFAVVKNKDGEVMLRENETGTLSSIQLLSLEEKEASIQNQEVEEV